MIVTVGVSIFYMLFLLYPLISMLSKSVIGEDGKVDVEKAAPVIFDPFNNEYRKIGAKAGNAFSDGKELK